MNFLGLFGPDKSNTVRGIALVVAAWFLVSQGVLPADALTAVSGDPDVQVVFPEGVTGAVRDLIRSAGVIVGAYGGRNLLLKMATAAAGK